MIIGIDGNEANVEKQVGVSVYTRELLEHFAEIAKEGEEFIIYLRQTPLGILPKENTHFKYRVVKGPFLWSQIFLPLDLHINKLSDSKPDVFFAPAHYAPRFCPCPVVVTIHDLSFFYYPQEFLQKDLYQLTHWTEYSVKQAKKIIAVSKTTKKDIAKFYSLPDSKIEIVYNGFEKRQKNPSAVTILKKFNLEKKKYLLYVGTLQPRKNITTLLRAYKQYKEINPELKLVLVGKKGWLYEHIYEEVAKLELKDEVIFTGYETDDNVAELYKNALCYILPSLYEGFGIPILEAMSYDCLVIASHASSLPEIGANACLYFDPHNADDLRKKISLIDTDHELVKELISLGKQRIKQFSWKKCADETLEIIKAAVN